MSDSYGLPISERQIQPSRFWRKYMRLMRAGVPVLRALQVIAEEEEDELFARTITSLRESMIHGEALHEGLARHKELFGPTTVELIRTAEKRGEWDAILVELTEGLSEGTFE